MHTGCERKQRRSASSLSQRLAVHARRNSLDLPAHGRVVFARSSSVKHTLPYAWNQHRSHRTFLP